MAYQPSQLQHAMHGSTTHSAPVPPYNYTAYPHQPPPPHHGPAFPPNSPLPQAPPTPIVCGGMSTPLPVSQPMPYPHVYPPAHHPYPMSPHVVQPSQQQQQQPQQQQQQPLQPSPSQPLSQSPQLSSLDMQHPQHPQLQQHPQLLQLPQHPFFPVPHVSGGRVPSWGGMYAAPPSHPPHGMPPPPPSSHPHIYQPPLSHYPSIVSTATTFHAMPGIPEGPPSQIYTPPPVRPISVSDTRRRAVQPAEVKLEISAKGLRDRDRLSKSDPTCVVFLEKHSQPHYSGYSGQFSAPGAPVDNNNSDSPAPNIEWEEIGRTECIKDCLDPHFREHVTIPYHFERLQHVRLGLWDIDTKQKELDKQDFLGEVYTTVGELVMSRTWTQSLTSPNERDNRNMLGRRRDLGKITVNVHENRDGGNMLIKASLRARKLDKKDIFSSDPYFIVTQIGASSSISRSKLYTSEVIKRTTNPVWKPFQLKVSVPKGGDKSNINLEFLVYDKDNHKRDDEIGKSTLSLVELENTATVPVLNDVKKKRRRYQNSGTLEFSQLRVIKMPSLVDYFQGGLKLHFSVAIDMTASNKPPSDQNSLHYIYDYGHGNGYTRALIAIANVLKIYTPSDDMFAAYGFGAELPSNPGYMSSCFPLGLTQDPMCLGIEGIMKAYSCALQHVRLSGPTNFAPLIEQVSRTAEQRANSHNDQHYDVLLILTDGVVSDYNLTVDRIIAASHTVPLSIIIVGIGGNNFTKMKELDSDERLLTSGDGARQAARDICQFVAFRDYENAPLETLGSAVLAELPQSIVEYFVSCDPPIVPGQL